MNRIDFEHCDDPRASIVILAWRQHDLLEKCLASIKKSAGSVRYEIIVVLNGASADVEQVVRTRFSGLHVVSSRVNLGFGGGNNRGAETARGEYLVFLNDDTEVERGWLEWLVATADANPGAGAVGSCILFPDGRIQEAGSLIWRGGLTMPVGRGLPGNSHQWQFVRRVDYSSACSLLVRRSMWDRIGRFDENYFPAYYEDVDLSLAIRAAGSYVVFEPRSRVFHHESVSSNEMFKQFLFRRNQQRLAAKWQHFLSFHEPAEPWSPPAITRAIWRARGCPRRILIVDDCVPDRAMGSGFGRMFDALVELSDQGYAITLHPTARISKAHDTLISKGIDIMSTDVTEHIARPDVCYDIVIVSRPHNFDRLAPAIRRHQPSAVLVYDAEALYWRRLERQAELVRGTEQAEGVKRDALAVRLAEERIFRDADYAILVSKDEAKIIEQLPGHCPTDVLHPSEPNLSVTTSGYWQRSDAAFVAGWLAGADSPNGDGLRWFVREVLPLLRARIPWVTLRVTGANPPPAIRDLADSNVRLEGHVDSLARFYDSVRVVIVPIRFGAGVKLKTVEALQYGVPVVSTSVGAEGIDTGGLEAIDITDDPVEFAERTTMLLTDPDVWNERRQAIARLVGPWRTLPSGETWTGAVEKALSRRTREHHSLFV